MKASHRITISASLLLIVCMAASTLILCQLEKIQTGTRLEDVLYITSPKFLKRMSLGYDGLLADIYWTRAVQYFGAQHHKGSGDFRLLAPLLQVAVELVEADGERGFDGT